MLSSRFFSLFLLGSLVACDVRLSLGHPGDKAGGSTTGSNASDPGNTAVLTPAGEWTWASPLAGGATLRGISGTSDSDIWLAGDFGTVLHYDGTKTTRVFKGEDSVSFHAVYSGAPGDVWIAGDGNGDGSTVAHFDGKTWTTDWTLSSLRIQAFTGRNARDVWAFGNTSTNGPTVQHWDGSAWENACAPSWDTSRGVPQGTPVRDMFATAKEVWMVGGHGFIARATTPHSCFTQLGDPSAGKGAYAPNLHYLSVWGASDNDVWALFVDETTRKTGYSHYDGTGWKVAVEHDNYTSAPAGALRTGKLIGATGKNVVSTWASGTFDGTSMSQSPVPTVFDDGVSSNVEAVYTSPTGKLYGAADFGGFVTYDASRPTHPWVSMQDDGVPATILALAPIQDDLAFGIGGQSSARQLMRWNGKGWHDENVATADGTPVVWVDVSARARDDVWTGGVYQKSIGDPWYGAVGHFDGKSWTVTEMGSRASVSGVFAAAANDVWAVGCTSDGHAYGDLTVRHFDGASWSAIAVPAGTKQSDKAGCFNANVFAANGEAWISVNMTGSAWVLHWDGKQLLPTYPGTASVYLYADAPRLFATSNADVWLSVSPVAQHFDGTTWQKPNEGTDHDVFAMLGVSATDVYQVGSSVRGGAIRHTDGTSFTTVLETSPQLKSIARAPDGTIWVGGEGGATLRFRPASRVK